MQNIVSILSDTGDDKGGGGNDYFKQAGINLLQGVVLHLMYEAYREHKALPTLTDCSNFLSSPERSIEEQLQYMKIYPHMSVKEFLQPVNIFEEIYGDYISNYRMFQDLISCMPQYSSEDGEEPEQECPKITCLNDLKEFVRTHLPEDMLEDESVPIADLNDDEISAGKYIDIKSEPWCLLLSHPRVASKATEVLNKADKEQSGVISMAKTCLSVYENPNIAKNLAYSDFKIKDLLTLEYEVSLYLVIPPSELEVLKNLIRLFIEFILRTLVVRMEAEKRQGSPELTKWQKLIKYFNGIKKELDKNFTDVVSRFQNDKEQKQKPKKKQKLLLMCDEFPQFGTLTSLETALAVMAGYGIRACLIAQDINQLSKRYTEKNSIMSNCIVNVFYTPNQESNNATSKMISETLGNKTIHTKSRTRAKENSTSTQSTSRSLMTPDEVSHMPRDKALILASGTFAIMANKLHYFKHKYFTKRLMDPPIISDVVTQIRNFDDLMEQMQGYFDDLAARKEKVRLAKMERGDFEQEVHQKDIDVVKPESSEKENPLTIDDLPPEEIEKIMAEEQKNLEVVSDKEMYHESDFDNNEASENLNEFITGDNSYFDSLMKGDISEEAEEEAIQAAISNEIPLEKTSEPARNLIVSKAAAMEQLQGCYDDKESEFDCCEEIFNEYFKNETFVENNTANPKNSEQMHIHPAAMEQIVEAQHDKAVEIEDRRDGTDDILDIFSNMG